MYGKVTRSSMSRLVVTHFRQKVPRLNIRPVYCSELCDNTMGFLVANFFNQHNFPQKESRHGLAAKIRLYNIYQIVFFLLRRFGEFKCQKLTLSTPQAQESKKISTKELVTDLYLSFQGPYIRQRQFYLGLQVYSPMNGKARNFIPALANYNEQSWTLHNIMCRVSNWMGWKDNNMQNGRKV